MNEEFLNQMQWSNQFIPEIKKIVGPYMLKTAPELDDTQRATDVMTLGMNFTRIACRVRKHEFFLKYPDEFTIRSVTSTGNVSEFSKIMSGWGDYLFYGFTDIHEHHIEHWRLGSLNAFRLHIYRELQNKREPWEEKTNLDGSFFRAFIWTDVPDMLIATETKP
jgi:hypothetical protein